MNLIYHSTRNTNLTATPSQAIINGLAPDGGLYVPSFIPKLELSFTKLSKMNYKQVAYEVMKLFLPDFTKEELHYCIENAYADTNFDHIDLAPMVKTDSAYYLELYHGRTIAFKDMALSILPYLLTTSAKKNNIKEDICILTATSGDTGKAALAGFASVPGTRIVVFYPENGVSKVQERQMTTQQGDNVKVVAVKGNFDDTQTGVKKIFSDEEFKEELKEKGYILSSANSINIGRLVPQIAYYVYAYTRILPSEINFVVPTGNFGNILAAYYAKEMGLPINKLICASNDNKVLFDFFKTGIYNKNRDFILTESPSMDILVSSNLERLIYDIAKDETANLMNALNTKGSYEITDSMKAKLDLFIPGYATNSEMKETIKATFTDEEYLIDTHTAVATTVYNKYVAETNDTTPTVIVSTASPYKFAKSILAALGEDSSDEANFMAPINKLCEISKIEIPKAVANLGELEVLHNIVCEKNEMKQAVASFLK